MNIFARFESHIADAIHTFEKQGIIPAGIGSRRMTVEPAGKGGHGDIVTNAALTLAKAADMKPRALAGLLAAALQGTDGVEKIEIAGPGFINLTLTKDFWARTLAGILASGADYGRGAPSPEDPVSIGCVAPGPIESIRVRDLRPILTADALANTLEFAGRKVSRELAIGLRCASEQAVKADLFALGVHHDVVFFEQSQQESANENSADIASSEAKALAALCDGGIEHALIKSNGEFTIFVFQLAYHRDRLIRGFKRMITVLGANHYAATQTEAAVHALTGGGVDLQMNICQPMRITHGGQPVEISKKAGSFPTAAALAAKVGPDSLRFMTLFRKNGAPLEFDLDDVSDQSWDNPVFYVQYAHARAHSTLRNLREVFPGLHVGEKQLCAAHLHLLTDEAELSVIKRLSQFPRVIEFAAEGYEPQRITFFLYELAAAFHGLWNRSKESPQLRFNVHTDRELMGARVALVAAAARTMQTGLGLLGVKAVSEMR